MTVACDRSQGHAQPQDGGDSLRAPLCVVGGEMETNRNRHQCGVSAPGRGRCGPHGRVDDRVLGGTSPLPPTAARGAAAGPQDKPRLRPAGLCQEWPGGPTEPAGVLLGARGTPWLLQDHLALHAGLLLSHSGACPGRSPSPVGTWGHGPGCRSRPGSIEGLCPGRNALDLQRPSPRPWPPASGEPPAGLSGGSWR